MVNRCHYCDKELDELGFRCQKCKKFCCSAHRLPEVHECISLYIIQEVKTKAVPQKTQSYHEELYEIEGRLLGNPDNAILLLKKAQLLNIMNKPGISSKTYRKYIEIENENAQAWFELGIQLEKIGNLKFAMNAFRNAADLDYDNVTYKIKFQEVKNRQMERIFGADTHEIKLKPQTIENKKENYDNEIEADNQNIPQTVKYDALNPEQHKDKILKKIGNKFVIRVQIDQIEKMYKIKEDSGHFGVIYVQIYPNYIIKVNLDKYPLKPVFELPIELSLQIGDPAVILRTLRTWNVYDEPQVLTALNELRACLGFWNYAPILISERFIRIAFNFAKDFSPNEMEGFIKLDKWVVWGLESPIKSVSTPETEQVPVNDIPSDDSVIGMIYSHPADNAAPSMLEQQSFKQFQKNIIISISNKAMRLFDRNGKDLKYEIVNIDDSNRGIKTELTLFNIIGRGKFSQREDNDRIMFS